MPEYSHFDWTGLEGMQCATNGSDNTPPEILLRGDIIANNITKN